MMVRVMYSVGGDNNCGTRTLLSKDGKLGKGGKRQVSGAHMANSLQFLVWLSTLLTSLCASAEEVDGPRQYIVEKWTLKLHTKFGNYGAA